MFPIKCCQHNLGIVVAWRRHVGIIDIEHVEAALHLQTAPVITSTTGIQTRA